MKRYASGAFSIVASVFAVSTLGADNAAAQSDLTTPRPIAGANTLLIEEMTWMASIRESSSDLTGGQTALASGVIIITNIR